MKRLGAIYDELLPQNYTLKWQTRLISKEKYTNVANPILSLRISHSFRTFYLTLD